mmetsp:Transcript_241/g.433  ORF Transcript_241/g.433 Transcript_241/m.433 type:complete len:258 (-) Transcript_241:109-882(-)|eukprot:CAMPEP_0185018582 /NCGR_PEP_ID=MMETSP1103-20130426/1254_1 /TAXON_ID=36769 /ORGANISM="Paraphysomonas bandaiensis, Strain Caron Lab Isolate" /LENGTH=257 /DNA_ID=CAMNT_0027548437 /DNA_START=69 /DNA_END=842 /DNA_ORIENTATION=-
MSEFRRSLIGGNWKCNGTVAEVAAMIENLNKVDVPSTSEVVIGVPSIHLATCKANFKGEIAVASEDVSVRSGFGAYTGEITAQMLVDSGVMWAIVGHSERRDGFNAPGESDELVGQKTKQALDGGMSVIVCIGENLSERESGVTNDVNGRQLSAIASLLTEQDWARVVIAYEPKWAIGTGKVATPAQAEETHVGIREWLAQNVSPTVAACTRILYGGSVKASNCRELIACPNIDGFLVGGASLKPEFADIIRCTVPE